MDLWDDLEARIRRRGVRVRERLALLDLLRRGEADGTLADEREALLERVRSAARQILQEAAER